MGMMQIWSFGFRLIHIHWQRSTSNGQHGLVWRESLSQNVPSTSLQSGLLCYTYQVFVLLYDDLDSNYCKQCCHLGFLSILQSAVPSLLCTSPDNCEAVVARHSSKQKVCVFISRQDLLFMELLPSCLFLLLFN